MISLGWEENPGQGPVDDIIEFLYKCHVSDSAKMCAFCSLVCSRNTIKQVSHDALNGSDVTTFFSLLDDKFLKLNLDFIHNSEHQFYRQVCFSFFFFLHILKLLINQLFIKSICYFNLNVTKYFTINFSSFIFCNLSFSFLYWN